MPMRVLVTGGAGYIGAVLVPELLRVGYAVTVLDNFMYRQSSLLASCANEHFSVIRGDCRDASTLRCAMKDADVIIPLAAIVGAPACQADQTAARSTNLDAIKLLVKLRSPSSGSFTPPPIAATVSDSPGSIARRKHHSNPSVCPVEPRLTPKKRF